MMLDLLPVEALVHVQEEPALVFALPQVFTQPELTLLRRGKLSNLEWLVARLHRTYADSNATAPLGSDYQALVNEFQPLFAWGIACWDYLLTTEGCRFVLRHGDEKMLARGDYRVVTDGDYSRLLHRVFREHVMEFAGTSGYHSLCSYLRTHFWPAVAQAYRSLEDPPDPSQRTLTAYSYLRCVPYRFLNRYHHERVLATVNRLPAPEQDALQRYFLKFRTLASTAEAMGLPADETEQTLSRGLTFLLVNDRLVYCLLRQIERY